MNKNFKWYVVNTYAGHEKKAEAQLLQRIEATESQNSFGEILVPIQNKIMVSEGKKKTVEERIFPGYILVQMEMNDLNWSLVRNTEGVTGFVGTGKTPTPLSPAEVESIKKFMKVEQPAYLSSFSIGDAVKITDGAFADFVGSVKEINEARGQVKVLISVFGRETPIDLDLLQVKKL
jgi:transcriptional antiterminator NusG